MRPLWNIVSFLAVAHLLMLLMFVGWLWQSGRLGAGRMTTVRETFRLTVAQAEAADAKAAETIRQAEAAALDEQRRENPSLPSSEQVRITGVAARYIKQTENRLKDLTDQLNAQIESNLRRIELQNEALETERKRYVKGVDDIEQRKNDAQFIKAVKLLESLKPKVAKERLSEMAAAGDIEQAVAYLDAMSPRPAGRILAQFKGEDGSLATELLERLRTYGVRPDGADVIEDATNAEPLARAP